MNPRVKLVDGNIVKLHVDAIVNAANGSLLGGGGVDGAIHRAAGRELYNECVKLNGCTTGEAKITKGYKLPAKCVIHTVGPIWNGGNSGEAELLANCYRNSLALALKHNLKTIAFPAIICGVYGYPLDEACGIAVREATAFLNKHSDINEVIFVAFGNDVKSAYQKALNE
jgi:O-acetyl-ADP-ribose deacetylase